MSDIPAGWHPDPTGRHPLRWWDGSAWTDHVHADGTTFSDPLAEVMAAMREESAGATAEAAGSGTATTDTTDTTATDESSAASDPGADAGSDDASAGGTGDDAVAARPALRAVEDLAASDDEDTDDGDAEAESAAGVTPASGLAVADEPATGDRADESDDESAADDPAGDVVDVAPETDAPAVAGELVAEDSALDADATDASDAEGTSDAEDTSGATASVDDITATDETGPTDTDATDTDATDTDATDAGTTGAASTDADATEAEATDADPADAGGDVDTQGAALAVVAGAGLAAAADAVSEGEAGSEDESVTERAAVDDTAADAPADDDAGQSSDAGPAVSGTLFDGSHDLLRGGDVHLQAGNLLHVRVRGGATLHARRSAIALRRGDVTTGEDGDTFVAVGGTGDVLLGDAGRQVHLVEVHDAVVRVAGSALLGWAAGLRAVRVAGGAHRLTGSGWVAITTRGVPVTLEVDEHCRVARRSLVLWTVEAQADAPGDDVTFTAPGLAVVQA